MSNLEGDDADEYGFPSSVDPEAGDDLKVDDVDDVDDVDADYGGAEDAAR